MKIKILLFVVWVFVATLTSCDQMTPARPPFSYESFSLIVDNSLPDSKTINLAIVVRNNSELVMNSLNITFRLYDSAGNPVPAFGNNYFLIATECSILPDMDASFEFDLSELFYYPITNGLIIDDFSIPKIIFEDLSVWKDSYDLYGYPGQIYSEAM